MIEFNSIDVIICKRLIKSEIKCQAEKKHEFQMLNASASLKLDILSKNGGIKEKYLGKKTDTENTIRKDC